MVFDNTFYRVIVHIGKWVVGSSMRTYSMNDAKDPYEHEIDSMGGNIRVGMLKQSPMEEDTKGLPQILQPP